MKNSTFTPKGDLALRIFVMPSDLNGHKTVFGGAMMSYLDQAGAIIAADHIKAPLVLKGVKDIHFITPCFQSERLSFYGQIVHIGRTSISVQLDVYREHVKLEQPIHATTATYVFVQVDENLQAAEIKHKELPIYN